MCLYTPLQRRVTRFSLHFFPPLPPSRSQTFSHLSPGLTLLVTPPCFRPSFFFFEERSFRHVAPFGLDPQARSRGMTPSHFDLCPFCRRFGVVGLAAYTPDRCSTPTGCSLLWYRVCPRLETGFTPCWYDSFMLLFYRLYPGLSTTRSGI